MLNVEHVDVTIGEMPILNDVTVEIGTGQLVALAGPNGAGKTTLLRAISGLLNIRGGRILLGGEPIQGMPPHRIARLGVAHVPEGRGVLGEMSVGDNLRVGGYARKDGAGQADFDRVFELFPVLKERFNQQAGMLSGGEQQMLAIGRGLLSSPKVLIVDELSLGLAPKVTSELLRLLKRLSGDGLSVLLVEQNVHQILRLADRAYVLVNGSIVYGGVTADLAARGDLLSMYFGKAPAEGGAGSIGGLPKA